MQQSFKRSGQELVSELNIRAHSHCFAPHVNFVFIRESDRMIEATGKVPNKRLLLLVSDFCRTLHPNYMLVLNAQLTMLVVAPGKDLTC